MMKAAEHKRSVSWFVLVGALAAAVHYIVAVVLEAGTSAAPAWANVSGFLVAFPVSYIGHRKFSFSTQKTLHKQAFLKFLMVAVGAFIANQFLLLAVMQISALPFWFVLAVVMLVVAVSTYLLSRYWAFQ